MKQITAIVHSEDAQEVSRALVEKGFYVTQLATSGGFLRKGSTTLFAVVEDTQVDDVLSIISQHCRTRTQETPSVPTAGVGAEWVATHPVQISVGGATVIVTPVERFVKL